MARYNDLDINNWKESKDILTDSLWIFDKRDKSGVLNASYHGNFVSHILNQFFRKYIKKEDLILDPFVGGETSLIEAQRFGRNAICIELQGEVAKEATSRRNKKRQKNSNGQ